MKNQTFILLIIAFVMLGCNPSNKNQKLVVLTFDDAVQSHVDFVAPLLREKGFGATFFISKAWMNDTANFMEWEDVKELHDMGFEIANHSWTHEPMHTKEAIQRMEEDLSRLDSALLSHGIPKPVSFGYPSNFYSPGTVKKIEELGYRFARRGMQPEIPYGQIAHGPLFDPDINHRLVIPTSADAYPQWTLEYFKEILSRAERGKALILQFHGVPDNAHPWVHTDPDLFIQFMDYLEQQDVEVIALRDLDDYFSLEEETDDPALHYTHGLSGQYNPCPVDADVWVLAGQSNMQGAGRTPDDTISEEIWMMNMDDTWRRAESPLHRIFEARAPAYPMAYHQLYGNAEMGMEHTFGIFREQKLKSREDPIGGTGPGIYFARRIQEVTEKPVGLIPCALGGSTLEQWDPAGKQRGDSTLYGAMINRIMSTDREDLAGLVWYQGESEAMLGLSGTYEAKLLNFIDSFREDVERPDLPIVIVQIGRFLNRDPEMAPHWEIVRNAQLNILNKRENIYLTTGIDLPLDDCAHMSTHGNYRLGNRIADIVLSNIYNIDEYGDQIIPYSMNLKKDSISGSHYIHLHYKGVTGKLKTDGLVTCFELRFGNQIRISHVISKVVTDPADPAGLRLYLSALPDEPFSIICGPGLNPHMNVTDSQNMPIPAFGPVNIDLKTLRSNYKFNFL